MSKTFNKTKTKVADFPDEKVLRLDLKDLPNEKWVDIPMLDGSVRILTRAGLSACKGSVKHRNRGKLFTR